MKHVRLWVIEARNKPWVWALGSLLAVLAWQALTVQANYAGNWNGLFRTGRVMRVPERLEPSTHRDASPHGYDGEFYRFMAHDPLLRGDTWRYLDAPLVRTRRILVPLAAWLLAGGREGLIDIAYVLVLAGFIFGGVYWLGAIMAHRKRHAAIGLLFLAVPATVVSIDRMTVDVALGTLTACFAYQLAVKNTRALWFTLAAAGLVRETGLLLAGACVVAALMKRDLRKAMLYATAALPVLCWNGYLYWALPSAALGVGPLIPDFVIPRLQLGIVLRALDPPHYPLAPSLDLVARALDSLALVGMMGAAAMSALRLREPAPLGLRTALALHLGLFLALAEKSFWDTPFGYCRPFAPMFVLLLAGSGSAAKRGALIGATVVAAMVDLRLATEIKSQVFGVLQWLF